MNKIRHNGNYWIILNDSIELFPTYRFQILIIKWILQLLGKVVTQSILNTLYRFYYHPISIQEKGKTLTCRGEVYYSLFSSLMGKFKFEVTWGSAQG